jgi:hypothetical protein
MSDKTVFDFAKSETEKIFFTVNEYKGKHYIHVRQYYLDKETNDYKPTSKGVSFNVELANDFFAGVEKLKAEVK